MSHNPFLAAARAQRVTVNYAQTNAYDLGLLPLDPERMPAEVALILALHHLQQAQAGGELGFNCKAALQYLAPVVALLGTQGGSHA